MASNSPASPVGKPAKGGKEGKSGKETKKSREETAATATATATADSRENAAFLRQVAVDLASVTQSLAALKADVETLKRQDDSGAVPSAKNGGGSGGRRTGKLAVSTRTEQILGALTGDENVAIALAIRGRPGEGEDSAPFVLVAEAAALETVETARLAKIAYAFSSGPKVALLRLLLNGGEQSATVLGEGAGLTTGSLYHHLRELVHAEVIYQSNRSKYSLTPLGRRTTLALLALAQE